jgi:hypothetical protein
MPSNLSSTASIPKESKQPLNPTGTMEIEDAGTNSSSPINITDDDFLPTPPLNLVVTAWHSSQGFCENIPEELENLCREFEITGVTGAMYKEVMMGRYVYWSLRKDWTIVAGSESTYQERNDSLLFRTRRNDKLPPSYEKWIEPATIMDLGLGDATLAKARLTFSGGSFVPSLIQRKLSPSPSPAKLYQPTEIIFGSDDLQTLFIFGNLG